MRHKEAILTMFSVTIAVSTRSLRAVTSLCLLSTFSAAFAAGEPEKPADPLRAAYREDAEKCEFVSADGRPLDLVKQPLMRWSNDGDWSGDIFAWTHEGRPEVLGCLLAAPVANGGRLVFHEFHLLAEAPILPAVIQDGRRWAPAEGLQVQPLTDAPPPAATAPARLTQMRSIARSFSPHMTAESNWELRLLPQPLMRYGDGKGEVVAGALFGYVWPKGTDPELILLVECRRDGEGLRWYYAPIRFSNRALWLIRNEQEVWRVDGHEEPRGKLTTQLYTTAYARWLRNAEADGK